MIDFAALPRRTECVAWRLSSRSYNETRSTISLSTQDTSRATAADRIEADKKSKKRVTAAKTWLNDVMAQVGDRAKRKQLEELVIYRAGRVDHAATQAARRKALEQMGVTTD